MADDSQWHLSKSIPVALIFTVLVQFAGTIWFAAQLSSRVEVLERSEIRQDGDIVGLRRDAQAAAVQLGRIEAGIDALQADIARLVRALEVKP